MLANERRIALADLRGSCKLNPELLAVVLLDPPAVLHGHSVIDAVRILRGNRGGVAPPWLTTLGRNALRDQVNLLVPIGRASERTRMWIAEHGTIRMCSRPASGGAV